MRVALFGSPAFALPVLDVLQQEHELVAVVTQPARPVGRGLRLQQPPLAARALELGLEPVQPERLRGNREFHDWLAGLDLDVAVTAAYGRILPQDLLDVPREGFLNVHGSLLPRWRGAAPIQWALISGDSKTGISIMQTEAGLDTGPVRLQKATPIGPDETAPELFGRLAELGASAISEALALLAEGRLPLQPQDESQVTIAPLLKREDGLLDFNRPAAASYDRYRGVSAWPGTFFHHAGQDVKVHGLRVVPDSGDTPGTVLDIGPAGITVAAGDGALLLDQLQSPGRRRLAGRDWANGAGVKPGTILGT